MVICNTVSITWATGYSKTANKACPCLVPLKMNFIQVLASLARLLGLDWIGIHTFNHGDMLCTRCWHCPDNMSKVVDVVSSKSRFHEISLVMLGWMDHQQVKSAGQNLGI